MKIGVIGNGFVGQAMTGLRPNVDVLLWDKDPEKRDPLGLTYEDFIKRSKVIFVAVPTPMNPDGSCNTSIVETVVAEVKEQDPDKPIVIRSTVPPGTSESLGVSFMPEFLTERNWKHDFRNCSQWILGTHCVDTYKAVSSVFACAHDEGNGCPSILNGDVILTTPKEAELVKYVKNCFLATKVSFFNEIWQLCQSMGIDYEEVRHLSCDDSRIGHGHTYIPGPDGKRGFGGTCFPKDMGSLATIIRDSGLTPYVISGAISRNEIEDRPEKDWMFDKGRAVSE